MSIIYQAMNKRDHADKSWINEVEPGFNVNRALTEDYEAHYAEDESRKQIKKKLIAALGLTILLVVIYVVSK